MLKNHNYQKIPIDKNYCLVKIEKQHIPEITAFVAQKYYNQKHFNFDCSLNELIQDMDKTDELFSRYTTTFCIINAKNELCCTGRLIKREKILPFEEELDVNLDLFSDKVGSIYEFARFASDGNISFIMIEKMLRYMLYSVEMEHALVVASLDKQVFRKFSRIKYPIYKLGYPLHYLGSMTVPVGIKLSELSFYNMKNSMEEVLC